MQDILEDTTENHCSSSLAGNQHKTILLVPESYHGLVVPASWPAHRRPETLRISVSIDDAPTHASSASKNSTRRRDFGSKSFPVRTSRPTCRSRSSRERRWYPPNRQVTINARFASSKHLQVLSNAMHPLSGRLRRGPSSCTQHSNCIEFAVVVDRQRNSPLNTDGTLYVRSKSGGVATDAVPRKAANKQLCRHARNRSSLTVRPDPPKAICRVSPNAGPPNTLRSSTNWPALK